MNAEKIVPGRLQSVANFVEKTKHWVDVALGASPQASTVWAAVCLTLPFLTKALAAGQQKMDGFLYVTSRMEYYVALEDPMSQADNLLDFSSSPALNDQYKPTLLNSTKRFLIFSSEACYVFIGMSLKTSDGT